MNKPEQSFAELVGTILAQRWHDQPCNQAKAPLPRQRKKSTRSEKKTAIETKEG